MLNYSGAMHPCGSEQTYIIYDDIYVTAGVFHIVFDLFVYFPQYWDHGFQYICIYF